jgi:hypothetical protein
MCPFDTYIPHREASPIRHCSECSTVLCSSNETGTCWSCEPTWSSAPLWIRDLLSPETQDAMALLMTEEVPA